jgi:hypothetical protein
MNFSAVTDIDQRAACEFVQDVIAAVTDALTPTKDETRLPPSRRQLAGELGIGHDTLTDILKGRQWPRTDRLLRLANHVGVTVGVLD